MLATSIRIPTVEEIKSLSISDLAISSALAEVFRDKLREFLQIDPFCVNDPFGDRYDCSYSVVLDRQNPNRVVAMIANNRDPLPQLPWSALTGDRLAKIQIPKDDALDIKRELMPKETNNFYPYRRGGKVSGFIMFAFQICNLR